MEYKDVQYHLNYRQKDLYAAAKEARLVRLAEAAQPKIKGFMPLLSSALKLTITAFLVYEIAMLIYR